MSASRRVVVVLGVLLAGCTLEGSVGSYQLRVGDAVSEHNADTQSDTALLDDAGPEVLAVDGSDARPDVADEEPADGPLDAGDATLLPDVADAADVEDASDAEVDTGEDADASETDAPECFADRDCMAGYQCRVGVCVSPACTAPRLWCGSVCVDLQNDAVNCGACGASCPAGQVCTAGACTVGACSSPRVVCGSSCTDLQTDLHNCGACGASCVAGRVCVSGACL